MTRNLMLRPAVGVSLILAIPLVMTFIDRHKPVGQGWHWDFPDFVIMGGLLMVAGVGYEFLSRKFRTSSARFAAGAAIALIVLVIWAQLAVNAVGQLVRLLFR